MKLGFRRAVLLIVTIVCTCVAATCGGPSVQQTVAEQPEAPSPAESPPPSGQCSNEEEVLQGDNWYVACINGQYVPAEATPNGNFVPTATPHPGAPAVPVTTPDGAKFPPPSSYSNDKTFEIWGFGEVAQWATIMAASQAGKLIFFATTTEAATAATTALTGVTVTTTAAISAPITIVSVISLPTIGVMMFAAKYAVVHQYDVAAVPHPEAPSLEDVDWTLAPTLEQNAWATLNHHDSTQVQAGLLALSDPINRKLPNRPGKCNGCIEIRAGFQGEVARVSIAAIFGSNVGFAVLTAPIHKLNGACPTGSCIMLDPNTYLLESELRWASAWMMSSKIGNGDTRNYWLDVGTGLDKYYLICAQYQLNVIVQTGIRLP